MRNRVQKFTSTGGYLTQWGGAGSGDGQFNNPFGVTVDSAGNVSVTDVYNNRIQKFTSNGVFITQWGRSDLTDGQFNMPYGVTVDSAGNVYVADLGNAGSRSSPQRCLPSEMGQFRLGRRAVQPSLWCRRGQRRQCLRRRHE